MTLHLHPEIMGRLEQDAARERQPVEVIIAEILRSNVMPEG